jgi:Uncharacterized protein conserved in bacteria (DUF2200)
MRAFDVSPKRLILGAMTMDKHRIFTTELAKVYPLYVQKAERKNRTKDEVDQIIRWLTGQLAITMTQRRTAGRTGSWSPPTRRHTTPAAKRMSDAH